jgi:hypothetical protein
MDFIEALPRVNGKSVILTMVDRFSKYCHFILLAHPYTAETVAQVFFSEIVRLHGVQQQWYPTGTRCSRRCSGKICCGSRGQSYI